MILKQDYPPATRGTIVVWGLLGILPIGGLVWQVFHNLVPLRRLGFDVWYVEDSDRELYDPETYAPTLDYARYRANVERLGRHMAAIGFAQRWAFRMPGTDTVIGATDRQGLDRIYREAVAGINLCGAQEFADRHMAIPRRVYLETDPVRMQVLVAKGDAWAINLLDRHQFHYSYGGLFGRPECRVPLVRYDWRPTVPPVCLEFWADRPLPPRGAALSTILNWQHSGKDIEWQGETWHWSKDREFLRFIDLPRRARLPLELCLGGASDAVREDFVRHGWTVKRTTDYIEPDAYRDYILNSAGEFSAAKENVVASRSGWVSDRTVCYLAAGRPAIVQDTGIGGFLPTGEGLFTFSTEDQALAAIEAVASDYLRHADAARAIARDHLDADRVIGQIVRDIGLG